MNEEFIKEIIESTISGEPHLGTNLKEQCLMYFDNLISENKQLKEQLKTSEKARKEAIEYINKTRIPIEDGNSEVGLFDTIWGEELLNILDIDKGDE